MKRVISCILTFTMILSCFCGAASAANILGPKASPTLSGYAATVKAGTRPGELRITFDVTASKLPDSVGASSIDIYKENGTYVTTITGTTGNGMISSNGFNCAATIVYVAGSGNSYYAEVTVFATVGSVSDSRTITTNTVKVP